MITNQEIFDAAWQAFVVEQRPASRKFSKDINKYECQYRDPDGNRCAVGLCIPDADYSPRMEMCGPLDLENGFDNIEFESVKFAEEAQSDLHDEMMDFLGEPGYRADIRQNYLAFAERWGLEIPEVA